MKFWKTLMSGGTSLERRERRSGSCVRVGRAETPSSLPPRLAYSQSAAAAAAQQLQVAQQLAAQQAAAQAAAGGGGPPTTRYYTGSLHGREV